MAELKATLSIDGKEIGQFSILKGTAGTDVIDIRTLGSHGYFTYDPGFLATASCESSITFIDGDKGILQHRGYAIDDLAKKADYLEVCYILLNGDSPSQSQYDEFKSIITNHTMVHEKLAHFFQGFLPDAHPMAMVCGVVGAMSSFYHSDLDITDPAQRKRSAHILIAKMPTIAAMAYKYSVGQPFVYPRNELSYAENFLHMMFSVPAEEYIVSPIIANAMDRIFTLHADHEQNASTSTVRLAGSSGANPYACIAAGVASLWGPAHGGANEACLTMLEEIGTLETCHEVLKELGISDPLLDVAMALEKVALEDQYFIEKKLYPNVDFYSGIILKAIGIPTSMFTVIFAMSRTVGWIAHWDEMLSQPGQKIGRPRQKYTGDINREFVPLNKK